MFDKNHDGWLSREEILAVLRTLFKGVADTSLHRMVQLYDTNGNGRIDYKEFVYFYGNISAKYV
jgi:Ca2+-binding EF-hand superfamily protein